MSHEYDNIPVTEREEDVVLCLPDGSSVQVPQATVRRSATLQEAIRTSDTDSNVSISLPRGVLQDWLQSVDALEAAAHATGQGTDIVHHPRLLKYLRVRCFCVCVRQGLFACLQYSVMQLSLLVLLQGQRVVPHHDSVCIVLHADEELKYVDVLWCSTVQML